MTVSEIIEKLSKFDKDLTVTSIGRSFPEEVHDIYLEDEPEEMRYTDEPGKIVVIE